MVRNHTRLSNVFQHKDSTRTSKGETYFKLDFSKWKEDQQNFSKSQNYLLRKFITLTTDVSEMAEALESINNTLRDTLPRG